MIDFSEMLPVGMVTHGGQVAHVLANIAKRKHGVADWEAFHYERTSDSSFELTGGILSKAAPGAGKRWLEPHECVMVSMSELLAELQTEGLLTPDMSNHIAPEVSNKQMPPHLVPHYGTPTMSGKGGQTYLHLSLALPEDEAGRQRLLRTFHLQADFFGAQVVACSLEHSD